ncbi:MAG TPA: iron ABC transporter permease [Casimicrobiaceae bacterium]|nr:iron ABC transporter permease [Casimicrobiaceae bacterium]
MKPATPPRDAGDSRRAGLFWVVVGVAGFVLVPWYADARSSGLLSWLVDGVTEQTAPAALHALWFGRAWLWPIAAFLAAALGCQTMHAQRAGALGLALAGIAGLAYTLGQGFAIGPAVESSAGLARALPALALGQRSMGLGASLVGASFAMLTGLGLAGRGCFKGDGFVAASVVGVVLLVALFTLFPVARVLISAVQDRDGAFAPAALPDRLFAEKLWGLGCLAGAGRCGDVWNTLALAFCCAAGCTALGLAFALIATRTPFARVKLLRALAILPIITPPFVIGLGLILIFGRSGLVNHVLELAVGWQPGRWIYGLPGVLLAQVFAFTPIAFLVLIGVVEGVSPTFEEAAQTLRADRWRVFADVSLPLMRPGLANAFLVSFIESIADFGNPILLGGNYSVLSTEIFYSVVGAQLDQGRAATLGLVLLAIALGAFVLQRRLIAGKAYTAMTGKGDGGLPVPLPDSVRRACYAVALPWLALTLVIYAMALVGGFAELWGRDYSFTLRHYVRAFGVEWTAYGVLWTGAAWSSLWTTVKLSAIAAPITAGIGILVAYLVTRQRFAGQGAFEFATMLSFAIPGTVIGVSYILAFNVPPIEITGTALILVACNVFRNMPVGVRAGIAAMSQIDPSLDEASATLGARGFTTFSRVLLPLAKPAVLAALVYSFVRAVTTLSAVIFLVSAQYEWATTYIINRVVNGDYGVAIAYCSVLIVLMVAVIGLIQLVVGPRRLGRRAATALPLSGLGGTAA